MEQITSPNNAKLKLIAALQSRVRSRRKENRIVLEGVRLVGDALAAGVVPEFALITARGDDTLTEALLAAGTTCYAVDEYLLRTVSDTQQPQGVLAVCEMPTPTPPHKPRRALILDAIRDPGNLGTLLRTGAAAGVDLVVLAPGSVDAYNPKSLRAGMGAHFRVPVVERNWDEIAGLFDDGRVYLADGAATLSYADVVWPSNPWALIIGSEAHGATDEARATATGSVMIPMARETESLNAAMAAAVILFEAARQRNTAR